MDDDVRDRFCVAIGERIRRLRTSLAMTQRDLATAIGKDEHDVERIEDGLREIGNHELSAVARALGVSTHMLIAGK